MRFAQVDDFTFDLNRAATESCIKLTVREQEENALFDQLMIMQNKPFAAKLLQDFRLCSIRNG